MENPTCFISYSWENDEHKDWVRVLATELQHKRHRDKIRPVGLSSWNGLDEIYGDLCKRFRFRFTNMHT